MEVEQQERFTLLLSEASVEKPAFEEYLIMSNHI